MKLEGSRFGRIHTITTLLVLLLVSSCFNACNKASNKTKIGDIYLVKLDEKSFTTWKISKIERDAIWYICNDYSVSNKNLINSIDNPNNYTDAPKIIDKITFNTKQQLQPIKIQKNED